MEEEALILHLVQEMGTKWSKMTTLLPGRTDNAIKNRWNARMRREKRRQKRSPSLARPEVDPIGTGKAEEATGKTSADEAKSCSLPALIIDDGTFATDLLERSAFAMEEPVFPYPVVATVKVPDGTFANDLLDSPVITTVEAASTIEAPACKSPTKRNRGAAGFASPACFRPPPGCSSIYALAARAESPEGPPTDVANYLTPPAKRAMSKKKKAKAAVPSSCTSSSYEEEEDAMLSFELFDQLSLNLNNERVDDLAHLGGLHDEMWVRCGHLADRWFDGSIVEAHTHWQVTQGDQESCSTCDLVDLPDSPDLSDLISDLS